MNIVKTTDFNALLLFGGDIYRVVWDTHFPKDAILLRNGKELTRVLSSPASANGISASVTCKVISHDDTPDHRTISVASSAVGCTIIVDATRADLEAWLQTMKERDAQRAVYTAPRIEDPVVNLAVALAYNIEMVDCVDVGDLCEAVFGLAYPIFSEQSSRTKLDHLGAIRWCEAVVQYDLHFHSTLVTNFSAATILSRALYILGDCLLSRSATFTDILGDNLGRNDRYCLTAQDLAAIQAEVDQVIRSYNGKTTSDILDDVLSMYCDA